MNLGIFVALLNTASVLGLVVGTAGTLKVWSDKTRLGKEVKESLRKELTK